MMAATALRLRHFFPGPVAACPGGSGTTIGSFGVVGSGRNLPLQRPLVGAFEMPAATLARLGGCRLYLSRAVTMFFLPARLDARQGQLLAEDGGHFLHCQLDFEDMAAGLIAGLVAVGVSLRRPERLPTSPSPDADAAGALFAIIGIAGISIDGNGMVTRSLPFLPIISPRQMYLDRLISPCRGRACGTAGDRVRFFGPSKALRAACGLAIDAIAKPQAAVTTSSYVPARRCWPRSSARPSSRFRSSHSCGSGDS